MCLNNHRLCLHVLRLALIDIHCLRYWYLLLIIILSYHDWLLHSIVIHCIVHCIIVAAAVSVIVIIVIIVASAFLHQTANDCSWKEGQAGTTHNEDRSCLQELRRSRTKAKKE